MKVQLIRNATLKVNYAGKTILIDPMLVSKGTFPPFVAGLSKNPTIDLIMSKEEVIKGIDCVLVTHNHPDHFDELSGKLLSKNIKLFCTPVDNSFFEKQGFMNKEAIEDDTTWSGIKITRIEGQHGSGKVLSYMGKVSGYILQAKNEPTVYIVSDSILIEEVENAIKTYNPQIIITNSGGGIIPNFESTPVLMNEQQTITILQKFPKAKIIAVHLEAIDFCKVTRKSLRAFANKEGIPENRLLIPMDGEQLNL